MSFKGGKTYSRKGGGAGGKASNPFDRLMKEQCNRPVASKSAGIVGRWGQTSYTSLRTATGEKRDGENIPRPKKFFKSRTTENDGVVAYNEESDEKEYVSDEKRYVSDEKKYVSDEKSNKTSSKGRLPREEDESVQAPIPSPKSSDKPAKKFFTARNKKPKLDVDAGDDAERLAKASAGDDRARMGRPSRNQPIERADTIERSAKPSAGDVPARTGRPRTKTPLSERDDQTPTLPLPTKVDRVKTPEAVPKVSEDPDGYQTPSNPEESPPEHPPIKLKLSLSKSPYKSGDKDHYKVVRSREEQAKFEEDQEDTMSSAASESSELSQSGSELLSAVVSHNDSDAASDLSNGVSQARSSYSSGYPDSDNDSTPGASPCVEPRSSPVRKQEPMPTRVARSRDPGTARVSRKSPISAGRGMHDLSLNTMVRPQIKKQPTVVKPSIVKKTEEQKVLESQSIDIVKQLEEQSQLRVPPVSDILPPPAKPPKKFFTSRNRPAKEEIVEKPKSNPVTLEFDADGLGESSINSPPHKSKEPLKPPTQLSKLSAKSPPIRDEEPVEDPLKETPKTSLKTTPDPVKTSAKPPVEQASSSTKTKLDEVKEKTRKLDEVKEKTRKLEEVKDKTRKLDEVKDKTRKLDEVKDKTLDKTLSPPPTVKPAKTRSNSPPPTVKPAKTRSNTPPPIVKPAKTRSNSPPPIVKPAKTRSNSPPPIVKPAKTLSNSPPTTVKPAKTRLNSPPPIVKPAKTRSNSPPPTVKPAKTLSNSPPTTVKPDLPPPRSKRIFTSRNKKVKDEPVKEDLEEPPKSLSVPDLDPSKRDASPPLPVPVKEPVPEKSPRSEPELSINFPARITHIPNRDASKSKPVKRSFFKSKAKDSGPEPVKKALSMYNQRKGIGGDKEELKKQELEKALSAKSASDAFEMDFDSEPTVGTSDDLEFEPGVLTRVATYPTTKTGLDEDGELVTSVKCPKSYKEYFTVIKNVKKAHEINDFGEFQEFNDDVDYILDGLASRHKTSTRCLATISLASKCMKPGFRMHLRAHGIVTKFFAELKDAPENPSLALCSATVLFVLSQDRLNMDLDRDSLELMLNLLDTDSHIMDLEGSGLDGKELERNKQKVVDLCSEMKDKGHAASLNLDLISADHLSMETLLSMTSKRAGEWFKEELRDLGGLEHLMRTFCDCINYLTIKNITVWTETLKEKLKKADRVLRVLENVSTENEENCAFLIDHKKDSKFLDCLFNLFRLLLNEVGLNPSTDASDKESIGVILRDTLLSVLRVYINLAHDYKNKAHGSLIIGSKFGSSNCGMIAGVVHSLFIMQEYMPRQKRFDLLVLCLTLLINLVEHCEENRQIIMDLPAPMKEDCFKEEPRMLIDDLIKLFLDREELARLSEDKTDNILDGVEEEVVEINPEYERKKEEKKKKKEKDDGKDSVDETINKLLSKAGHHMEYTLVASYVTIIVGYLIFDCEDYEQRFRELLPDNTFVLMMTVLNKFFRFMKMTVSGTGSSHRGLKSTEKILKYLTKVDTPPEPEEAKEEETFTDLSLFEVSNDDTLLDSQPKDSYVDDFGFDDWGKL